MCYTALYWGEAVPGWQTELAHKSYWEENICNNPRNCTFISWDAFYVVSILSSLTEYSDGAMKARETRSGLCPALCCRPGWFWGETRPLWRGLRFPTPRPAHGCPWTSHCRVYVFWNAREFHKETLARTWSLVSGSSSSEWIVQHLGCFAVFVLKWYLLWFFCFL